MTILNVLATVGLVYLGIILGLGLAFVAILLSPQDPHDPIL